MEMDTVGYLSFGPIDKLCFCNLSVREKDWRSRARGALLAVRGMRASQSDTRTASHAFERMRSTLSHMPKT